MPETNDAAMQNIVQSLEEIKAILKLVNHEKLDERRNALLKEGSMKKQVYDLCDGTRTIQDIASTLQKETNYIGSYLTILRREGLILTIEKEKRLVHSQLV